MSISFVVQRGEPETEGHTVKLFISVASQKPVEIQRNIILFDDDLDESEQFDSHCWNAEQRVCAHIIGKILSAPNNAESLVAWYATVGFASAVLALRLRPRQLIEEVRRQKTVVLTAESILERLGTEKDDYGNGLDFLLLSGSAIQCYLIGELDRNPSAISSVRERIREKTKSYLEQLRFPPTAIRNVESAIDRIDGPFLKDDKLSVETNPNAFWHSWYHYFRDLDDSDLSLYRPSKPFSIEKAYKAIRAWYQSHKAELSRLGLRKDDYIERSIKLIDALPAANSISDLEIRAVFQEVIMGLLEWAYHDSDGKYKMSEYAKLALQGEGLTFQPSADELKRLTSSWIWPYIQR